MKLILISLLVLLLTNCTTTQPQIPRGTYDLSIKIVETQQEVEKYCGKGKNGCVWNLGEKFYIYSMSNWCVMYHELDHLFFGSFHGKGATCKVRAEK